MSTISESLIENLKNHGKKKISLVEIFNHLPSDVSYEENASRVQTLIIQGYLKPIANAGRNNRSINLPNAFTIEYKKLNEKHYLEIEKYALGYESFFNLDYYFSHETEWFTDKELVDKIYQYLVINGFPKMASTSQERSYDLVGDEKWLDFKGGMKVLNQLKIKDQMCIENQNELAIFAINPNLCSGNNEFHKHLIVENKAIFYKMMALIEDTSFSTVIYGAGWRVISAMKDFNKQFPLAGEQSFYYFGDIDFEGLKIFSALQEVLEISVARDFYEALISQSTSIGKENQVENPGVFAYFQNLFSNRLTPLKEGQYWPQEALSVAQLKMAWERLDGNQ